ncbi:MAG: ATP-binding protein, partial [Clostridiales bacterium]|nr:ATP-binding protein [Clostridiales bacterium]
TCLVKCVQEIKHIILNRKKKLASNIFTDSDVCSLGITFLECGRKFSYDFKYNAKNEEFLYENFAEILKDKYGNEKEVSWIVRDNIKDEYLCIDEKAIAMMPLVSKNNLFCYLIDTSRFEHLDELKNIIINFAERIDIISMINIPRMRTIDLM